MASTGDRGELKQRHIFVLLGWPLASQPATHMDLPQLQSVMLALMGDGGYWAMILPCSLKAQQLCLGVTQEGGPCLQFPTETCHN